MRKRVNGKWIFGLWVLTAILSLVGLGRFLDESITGIVLGHRSIGPALLAVFAALVALVGTVSWARGLRSSTAAGSVPQSGRRRFLVGAATTTGGLIAVTAAALVRPRGWLTITAPSITPATPTSCPDRLSFPVRWRFL